MATNCSKELQNGSKRLQLPDSGIRTDGIFCSPTCHHLTGARYGGYQCTGFVRHLTRGPKPNQPFRCNECVDLAAIIRRNR